MSTIPDELAVFVKAALLKGVPRDDIQSALRSAGWTADQIRLGLGSYADTSFSIPVPRPQPYLDARDAFLYLVLFSTLYITCFNLGSLLFDFIDIALPDSIDESSSTYLRSSMRWSVASLMVAFPVFLYVSWTVARGLAADPNKRHSKVRRWLTYLTLFVASSLLIGDSITLVYNLLSGEITTRFLLKALVVGVIAGGVFWYYLSDIRREE